MALYMIIYKDLAPQEEIFYAEAASEEEARDIWAEQCPGEEIITLSVLKLPAKPTRWVPNSHWDVHENDDWSPSEWAQEVLEDNTRQSYIAWVNSRIKEDADTHGVEEEL